MCLTEILPALFLPPVFLTEVKSDFSGVVVVTSSMKQLTQI
jgi:hypothetical protein